MFRSPGKAGFPSLYIMTILDTEVSRNNPKIKQQQKHPFNPLILLESESILNL